MQVCTLDIEPQKVGTQFTFHYPSYFQVKLHNRQWYDSVGSAPSKETAFWSALAQLQVLKATRVKVRAYQSEIFSPNLPRTRPYFVYEIQVQGKNNSTPSNRLCDCYLIDYSVFQEISESSIGPVSEGWYRRYLDHLNQDWNTSIWLETETGTNWVLINGDTVFISPFNLDTDSPAQALINQINFETTQAVDELIQAISRAQIPKSS